MGGTCPSTPPLRGDGVVEEAANRRTDGGPTDRRSDGRTPRRVIGSFFRPPASSHCSARAVEAGRFYADGGTRRSRSFPADEAVDGAP